MRILINKIVALGFKSGAANLMKSYLQERKQYVTINGTNSDTLVSGPQSVIQGSTLACTLYLIYILDMQIIFHDKGHNPEQQRKCNEPNNKTFVDDHHVLITKNKHPTLEIAVSSAMDKVREYTLANKLQLNRDKTKICIITNNKEIRNNFEVTLDNKVVKHSKTVKVLGNIIAENLSWEPHVAKEVIPSLNNRCRTLRITATYLNKGFKALYCNAIFRSKMIFAIESWGGYQLLLWTKFKKYRTKYPKLRWAKKITN